MVVAFLRGLLRKQCDGLLDHLAEDMVLDAIDAELQAVSYRDSVLARHASLSCLDNKAIPQILQETSRKATRAAQLMRCDIYDSMRVHGLRGFGNSGQAFSLIKLFQIAKKHAIIPALRANTVKEKELELYYD